MPGTRAYALAVAEMRALPGANRAYAERVRALVRQAFGGPARVTPRDALGPIHRRVPGTPLVRDDEPTPADLERLLSGEPVPLTRAGATWRLVEAVVAGLAWSSTALPPAGAPPLDPVGLAVPAVAGLTVGWCTTAAASEVDGLDGWLAGAEAWASAAAAAGRPAPDVVVIARA